MTPEAQRIAIATACGWEFAPGYPQQLAQNEKAGIPWQYINGQHCADGAIIKGVPNYLNDLNAMHEAEKVLWNTHQQMGISVYYHTLNMACANNPALAVSATAAQRAEAFLRTLNLWTE